MERGQGGLAVVSKGLAEGRAHAHCGSQGDQAACTCLHSADQVGREVLKLMAPLHGGVEGPSVCVWEGGKDLGVQGWCSEGGTGRSQLRQEVLRWKRGTRKLDTHVRTSCVAGPRPRSSALQDDLTAS